MRRLTAAAAAAVALPVLVTCSPDSGDFREEAEKYIESRDFSEDAGLLRYSEVECDEPDSTAQDTRYTCTATAEDGSQWLFDVEITGDSDLRVIVPPTALSGSTTESTEAPSASAPESTIPVATSAAPTTSAPDAAATTPTTVAPTTTTG